LGAPRDHGLSAFSRCRDYRFIKALPDAGGRPLPKGSGIFSTLPPAVVIAAAADAEKAWADTRIGRFSEPCPRIFTRSLGRHSPASIMVWTVNTSPSRP